MAEADSPTFGELLRTHRLAAHLTQEELAERAQLSRRAIQELERGTRSRPRRETVHLLAEALGLDTLARASLEAAARLARTPGTNGSPPAHPRVGSPVLLTNFVGRERELAQLSRLLGVARLVTLTGAGGIGKTRLAMRVASSVAHQFTEGVVAVELAALTADEMVLPAIARSLGMREQPGELLPAAIARFLRDKSLLLVLDNFEHVLPVAVCIAELLRACPKLKVLATSRSPLHVEGEQEMPVPPMAIPVAPLPPLEQINRRAARGKDSRQARFVIAERVMAEPAAPDTCPGSAADGPLVGRRAELARILTALDTVGSGHGCTVLLFGEPGVGKTRLAQEVLARARDRGAQVWVGRAFEQHTAVPFFPFTEALAFKMTETSLPPLAEVLERWPELARLLPDAGTEQPTRDGHDTQLRVFRAATAFFHALAEVSPLVLLLDDLHWADTTSLSLVLYMCRHLAGARILVLCTYRDVEVDREHPLAETVRELVRERLADEVHVGRLAVDETAALVRAKLAGSSVSDALVSLVHDRAEGNPFFTEELLKALVEWGVVSQVQGRWEAHATSNIEVPRSVRSVVGQRVSRLAPDVQELLRLASVVGQEFELEVLLSAGGRLESDVLSQLDAALGAGLLEERGVGNVERYGFAHALIQQTLYDELPNHRRRRLHRRVGEALEALGAGQALLAAQLARHFLAAGDDERATRYSIEAAEHAAAGYAHAEAVRHYQVAVDRLSALGEDARAAGVQHRLALELYDLNRLGDALSAYAVALGTYERLGDLTGQARVHHGIGRLEHGRYDIAAEVPHLDAALQLWPSERQDAELAWLLLDGSQAKHYSGDWAAASRLAERGLALAEQSGDSGLLSRALVCVSHTRMRNDPRPSTSIALLDRAERVAHASDEWRVLSRVYLTRAIPHFMAGDLERALVDRRRAVDAAERSGEIERLAFAYQTVADTCLVTGAWQEGRIAAQAGLALDPQGLLKGMPGAMVLTWMNGRAQEALEHLRAFVDDARRRVDLQGMSHGLAHLAELELQLDRPAEAEAPAREAGELMRVGGSWQAWPGRGCGPLAETLVRLGTADAEDTLAAAEQMVAAAEQYAARPQLLRARGLLLQRQGALDAASEAFAASADVARSQHALIQLGRTLDRLADVARQRGEVSLAAEAEAELVQLVDRIGPEVSVLKWARRIGPAVSRLAVAPAYGPLATGPISILTAREREVVDLVARGLTNRQIAAALVIAEGTAGVHVDHILTKLRFRSRAQVAAWAVEHGLLSSPKD